MLTRYWSRRVPSIRSLATRSTGCIGNRGRKRTTEAQRGHREKLTERLQTGRFSSERIASPTTSLRFFLGVLCASVVGFSYGFFKSLSKSNLGLVPDNWFTLA